MDAAKYANLSIYVTEAKPSQPRNMSERLRKRERKGDSEREEEGKKKRKKESEREKDSCR